MILHGDEIGRTQDGNNNTYAQDSEITWVHWDDADQPLVRVHRGGLPAAARAPDVPPQALLHRHDGAHREPATASASTTSSGCTWTAGRWRTATGRRPRPEAIGMYLNGHGIAGLDARGGAIIDDHFLLYFNADGRPSVTLPAGGVRRGVGRRDRHRRLPSDADDARAAGATSTLGGRSVLVLRERTSRRGRPDSSVAASVAASVASRADRPG